MDLDSSGSDNTGQAPAGPASGKDVYFIFLFVYFQAFVFPFLLSKNVLFTVSRGRH